MRRIVFHPFLLAVAPILYLFVHNARRFALNPNELLLPIGLALVSTGLLLLIFALLLRNWAKAGIVVSWAVLLFFVYGHIFSALRLARARPGAFPLLLILLELLVLWLVIRARGNLSGLTTFMNAAATMVVLINLVTGLTGTALRNTLYATRSSHSLGHSVRPAVLSPRSPDIYYIILDTYIRSDYLKADYGTDNSGFLSYLTQNGFYVAIRARSNYAQTHLSLASSLNMTYLDSVVAEQGAESQDVTPLIRMIETSRVAEFLKAHGYRVVTYVSGYTGTELKDADVHLAPRLRFSEFSDVLLEATILPRLLGSWTGALRDELHRQTILYTLRTIPRAARGKQPSFVFAHVLCPHTPFVFDSFGNRPHITPYERVSETGTNQVVSRQQLQRWYQANYGPQVIYLSRLVQAAVKQILADASRPAIIVVQGDHGAGSIMTENADDPAQLPRRHAILDAIHLPGTDRLPLTAKHPEVDSGLRQAAGLYDSISPVNTFRVILNQYFDTSVALLPDRRYFSLLGRPYRLQLVTAPDRVP